MARRVIWHMVQYVTCSNIAHGVILLLGVIWHSANMAHGCTMTHGALWLWLLLQTWIKILTGIQIKNLSCCVYWSCSHFILSWWKFSNDDFCIMSLKIYQTVSSLWTPNGGSFVEGPSQNFVPEKIKLLKERKIELEISNFQPYVGIFIYWIIRGFQFYIWMTLWKLVMVSIWRMAICMCIARWHFCHKINIRKTLLSAFPVDGNPTGSQDNSLTSKLTKSDCWKTRNTLRFCGLRE